MLTAVSNWASFYTESLQKLRKSVQKGLILQNWMLSNKKFTPTCKHFLHGYIRHIRDISQLCPILLKPNFSPLCKLYCALSAFPHFAYLSLATFSDPPSPASLLFPFKISQFNHPSLKLVQLHFIQVAAIMPIYITHVKRLISNHHSMNIMQWHVSIYMNKFQIKLLKYIYIIFI